MSIHIERRSGAQGDARRPRAWMTAETAPPQNFVIAFAIVDDAGRGGDRGKSVRLSRNSKTQAGG